MDKDYQEYLECKNRVLEDIYDGDAEAMEKESSLRRHKVINWDALSADLHVYPEWDEGKDDLIRLVLGYLPPKKYTVRYDAFLKTALHRYKYKIIDYDAFMNEITPCLINMRNYEIIEHNYEYEQKYFDMYETHYPEFKDVVKDRLKKILGYTPELNCSLVVELGQRKYCTENLKGYLRNQITSYDMQAITIIKYRELLLTYGLDEAKSMPFFAHEVMERFSKGEIIL
ncbi:hypothetical protein ACQKCH_14665 [Nubsella zeaxanthinifaciens]|uniref:hypothetical protein n=1 Tax=Nubsella zeaxanthinifaciens TaxID=392412 RepID=UPI003D0189EC